MSDDNRSRTQVRLTLEQISRLIAKAEAGIKEYTKIQEDRGILQMSKFLTRPQTFWEKLFRLQRDDTSKWSRHEWLKAAGRQFYNPATSLNLPPWHAYYHRDEVKVIQTLGIVLKYARAQEERPDYDIDAHDIEVLENIATWAPLPSEPTYRNESV